jgi:deazaflavin-dependent oxidoreductase (nitroreductase family)
MSTTNVAQTVTNKPIRRSRLLGWLFRLPVGLYRIGLAKQLGRSTLLLTTRGRKTSRRRTTPLNYWTDGEVMYVLSGMGTHSDWLRNLQADPHVQVQVGEFRLDALADCVVDPVVYRRVLGSWAEQSLRSAPPPALRRIMRLFGFDYEQSVRQHLAEDPPAPIVALRADVRTCRLCSKQGLTDASDRPAG